jgi:cardiolipin synthase
MLILLLPFVGLLIFLLLGSPKLNKRRRAMQRNMDEIIDNLIHKGEFSKVFKKFITKDTHEKYGSYIKLNKNLGGFPAFEGNSVDLIDDYDGIITKIAGDIKKASNYVHIEYFIIVMDETTEILFVEIEKAIKRGVQVRILYDAIGSRGYPNLKQMKKRLDKIGVEWHPMLPVKLPGKNFNRPDLRNHRKIVVIDGSIGYTGSQNLVTRNYHRKDDLYYDELVARVTGPVVLQLEAVFITDWYSETGKLLGRGTNHELNTNIETTGNVMAQILPSGPGFDNDNNLKLFTALIHGAKKRVVIVNPYFVPDDALITAITSAAQRNVEVTMINSQIMDQAMVGNAQRSYFEELLKSGVNIYQYDFPILLHSKYMIIDDDIAVVGSSNLDMRSFQLDLEVTLVIYDSKVIKSLEKITTKYMKKTHTLKLSKWKLRPMRSKLVENLARLTASVQ